MIKVFYSYINKEKHEFLVKEMLPNFSIDFQKKILKYRKWQDTQSSLLGRALLKKGFDKMNEDFCEKKMRYNKYNKPYFEGGKVKFNISHSGEIVICALTTIEDVGIDIEKIRPVKVEDFKSQMTNDEWNVVSQSKDIEYSFFNYWTKKESIIKYDGRGLSIPLKSFEVLENRSVIGFDVFIKEIKIQEDYICHLALKQDIDATKIEINRLDF